MMEQQGGGAPGFDPNVLVQRIRRLVGKSEAKVEVFPVCEKDIRLRRTLTVTRLEPARRPGRPATPAAVVEDEETEVPDGI